MLTISHHAAAFEELLEWLTASQLTRRGSTLDRPREQQALSPRLLDETKVLGVPCQRVVPTPRDQLKALQERTRLSSPELGGDHRQWQAIWNEIRKPDVAIRELDVGRMPVDAMAFYRPFHVEPFNQWGIYILVPELLKYWAILQRSLGTLASFPPSVLASMALFEVFHHEFFHHLVECTATTLEVLWPTSGRSPRPVYLAYRMRAWEQTLGCHVSDPIEEALANAYAYNSFSFISRVRGGYLDRTSRIFQKALERSWRHDPPGYKEAAAYVKGGQLEGARLLVERMLSLETKCPELPLRMLVDAVFPKGHTAFWQKADVPTYLVGSEHDIQTLLKLVPAPNETYVNLFWPGDTKPLDEFIKEQKRKEQEQKLVAKEQDNARNLL
jgi:hypothetical protein